MKKSYLLIVTALLAVQLNSHAQGIVGGQTAQAGAYPWIAGLTFAGVPLTSGHFCGGSLIAPNWILTAAHCTAFDEVSPVDSILNPSALEAFLGVHTLSGPNPGSERIGAAQIFVHPNYQPESIDNDIALIYLGSSSSQNPLTLIPDGNTTLTANGTACRVMGWGLSDTVNFGFPDTLQEVDLQIVSNSICNQAQHHAGAVTADMLCAGLLSGAPQGSASGDSGGPLVVDDNGTWTQVGIVSWGLGLYTTKDFPGVYTRVGSYISWINNTMASVMNVSEYISEQNINVYTALEQLCLQFREPVEEELSITVVDLAGRVLYEESYEN